MGRGEWKRCLLTRPAAIPQSNAHARRSLYGFSHGRLVFHSRLQVFFWAATLRAALRLPGVQLGAAVEPVPANLPADLTGAGQSVDPRTTHAEIFSRLRRGDQFLMHGPSLTVDSSISYSQTIVKRKLVAKHVR